MTPETALFLIASTIALGVLISLAIVHVVRRHWEEEEHQEEIRRHRNAGRYRAF